MVVCGRARWLVSGEMDETKYGSAGKDDRDEGVAGGRESLGSILLVAAAVEVSGGTLRRPASSTK